MFLIKFKTQSFHFYSVTCFNMTAVVSYNFQKAFSPESGTRLAPETDPICTCLSFDLCVVPNSNIYFYIFFSMRKKRNIMKLSTSRLLSKWISLTSSSFKHHASFIIQIHQLAFLENTHSVARKYFEF